MSLRYTVDDLYNELAYDSEKWGEAFILKTSENLVTLPYVNWSYGYLDVSNGECQDRTNQNWKHTSEYISISAGSKINIRSSIKADTSVAMIAFYNAEKEFLPYIIRLVEGDLDYTVREDDNIAFVRFCLSNSENFTEQEVYVTTEAPVSTLKDNIDNIYALLKETGGNIAIDEDLLTTRLQEVLNGA